VDAAKLVLEYLRVIFAWPPIVGAVLVLFLALQRTAVARLLDRIRRLSYPGGEMEMPHYDPQPAAAPTPEIKSAPQEGDATVTALARDFDHFLFVSVQAGMRIIYAANSQRRQRSGT